MVKEKLSTISEKPGCYLMKDKNNKIIYIGKAKNLKKRVSQYFLKPQNGKTALMVSKVNDFDTIITSNEKEALLLEANLVKKYDPKYNVLLKDDKRFPYVKVSFKYGHPKLEIARSIDEKEAKYYGPFADSTAAYKSIDMLNQILPLRKCNTIPKKECLYYHLGMCLAPCINKVRKEQYDEYLDKIDKFYNGNTSLIKNELNRKMKFYSDNLEYEEAQNCKIMLEYLENLIDSQKVELNKNDNIDFFSSHYKDGYMAIVTFIYRNGILINKESSAFEVIGDAKDAFDSFVYSYYQKRIKPKEIVVPTFANKKVLSESLNIKVSSPTKGKRKDILDLVGSNAIKELEIEFAKTSKKKFLLDELKEILNLDNVSIIELYDISHFHGEDAIGVKVCFVDALPKKKLYRKYIIKNANTKDDLANLKEVLYRRLFKIISENDYKPDLIILDGGNLQLNVAKEILNDLNLNIPCFGLVKNTKHQTEGIVDQNGNKITLDKKSALFYLLVNMQDEVHRFAITSHINKRSKSLTSSILDGIKGLGKVRKDILLKTFGSVNELKKVSVEEISQYIPKDVAILVKRKLDKI